MTTSKQMLQQLQASRSNPRKVQPRLSTCLQVGHKDTKDEDTPCSTASRLLSSRAQQADDDVEDVCTLPDIVAVVGAASSGIDERQTDKTERKHMEAMQQLYTELTSVAEESQDQVRAHSLLLLSSLWDVNLRLDTLKNRMDQLEDSVLQEVFALWDEVHEELKWKKIRITEFNQMLTDSETQQSQQIKAVLRKYCHLLEEISFLQPADVHRLIHSKAMIMNQCLLTNRRSVARLQLHLQEENLQQEMLLRELWEERLQDWRRSRVPQVVATFLLCRGDVGQEVAFEDIRQRQHHLTQQRCDIISQISCLAPPCCSSTSVSDWFDQLTAVNQQIDSLHDDVVQKLRCRRDQMWRDCLADMQRCQEELSALQLSEDEVKDIINSQILTLIGRSQKQEQERLAALDLWADSQARATVRLSRCVYVVMRAAASLWETHNYNIKKKEVELELHLEDIRRSQNDKYIQRKRERLDELLSGLREEGSEDALVTSLDKTVRYLQDIKYSCRVCVTDQCAMLDRLPSIFMDELVNYSRSLSSFFHLDTTYMPSQEELESLLPVTIGTSDPSDPESGVRPVEGTERRPVSRQSISQPSYDWLNEAESCLLEFCDISSHVTFTSSKGVTYTGPTFRCPSPDLLNDMQQETHMSMFPVELLTHTLSRLRSLFMEHLEQHFHDALTAAVAMIMDKKEAAHLDQELQLEQLEQHVRHGVYQQRLAELQHHRQRVDAHCQEVSDVLANCRAGLRELRYDISRKNQEFIFTLSNIEDSVPTATSSHRVQALSSALQDCLDHHMKDTQRSLASFRQCVQVKLEDARVRTAQLLGSFRLFSEGGDFAPQEVKLFDKLLRKETKQTSLIEESILSRLDTFQSKALKQVMEASSRLEERLCVLQSEVTFTEKVQKILTSTRLQIQAEAARNNQQQTNICKNLQELTSTMDDGQVSPDQVCLLLSSVGEDFRKRHQYLDVSLDSISPSSASKSGRQVPSTPPPDENVLDELVVDVVRSLNRFSVIQDAAADGEQRRDGERRADTERRADGPNAVPHLRQRRSDSPTILSVRRGCRSIRADRRFQIFGSKPEADENPDSFSSVVTSVLWMANDELLRIAEEFYLAERYGRFHLLPPCVDHWAESMQQRLLGYQDQARTLLSTSITELAEQQCLLEKMMRSLPAVLIQNHEQHWGAELRGEAGRVRRKLEETVVSSEKEKTMNVRRLRASLTNQELQALNSREEQRQQQLHSAICSSHLELQGCVRCRGEAFVTSLASLTEKLLRQLDQMTASTDTEAVSMETEDRTCSSAPGSPSFVTMETAALTTNRCTPGHVAVLEERDSAVKRFEQVFRSELLLSDASRQRRLSELQSWNTHWREQIHTLLNTHTS